MSIKSYFAAAALGGCFLLVSCRENSGSEALTFAKSTAAGAADGTPVLRFVIPKPKPKDFICESDCGADQWRLARTQEEGEWLIRNGYPSPSEVAVFDNMSLDQLRRLAAEGSLAAQAEYGHRLTKEGRVGKGLAELTRATERGSLYAYYLISDIELREMKDRLSAGAFLRVAYLLGDTRAGDMMVGLNIHVIEGRVIDRRAASLLKTFARSRRPDPRPL
jgi:hypothetical protein